MIFEFELSDDDGQILVKMARNAVTEYLQNNTRINNKEFNSRFNIDSGIFVTITKENSLRGCIGYPLPIKKLSNAVIDSAIAAATEDPRFPAINPNELDNLIFEVTVLTPPIEIKVEKHEDYLSAIKIGRDGLIVENKQSSGLLLPQVPKEYGWDIEEFLTHTSEKAGLEKNAWKDQDTKVSRFEGIIFKEESPNGKIVRGII